MSSAVAITMVDLRSRAEEIVDAVQSGERFVLTYRGEPVMRLVPIVDTEIDADDLFYTICDEAAPCSAAMSNTEMDEAIYGA